MTLRALIIDQDAINVIQSLWEPPPNWFESFRVHDPQKRLCYVGSGDFAFVLSASAKKDSRLLVIDLSKQNFFLRYAPENRKEVFRRIRLASLSSFTSGVAIPYAWGPFKSGSLISFHATNMRASANGEAGRVELDKNPFGSNHVYVFNCSQGWSDPKNTSVNKEIFFEALKKYSDIIVGDKISKALQSEDASRDAVELTEEEYYYHENHSSLEEWYDSKLTTQQRRFVDADETRSLRLKGAPGTGKTLALTVKFLTSVYRRQKTNQPFSLLFLTHNVGAAAATRGLLESLDHKKILGNLRDSESNRIQIMTLLELANEVIGGDLHDVTPISTDALEGRTLQIELIESEIQSFRKTQWHFRKPLCSQPFVALMESEKGAPSLRRFAWELMNEFACVLDADGVRDAKSRRDRYLGDQRQNWMMPLANQDERKIVLDLYDAYRRHMREMHSISVDELIADYLGYLDSNRWDVIRRLKGYDAVFIDELHLFNRQERMVFHELMKSPELAPVVFMAYDAKQTPFDTFTEVASGRESDSSFWGRLRIGSIDKVELDEVFRYTPEIAAFISSLDQSFPALNLGDEWGEYPIKSERASGIIPLVCELQDAKDLYKRVFARASAIKKRGGKRGSVAVLCSNNDQFQAYLQAGEYKDSFVPITAREQIGSVRSHERKFVLSTPEYVAGLQFDVVLLVDINESEVPEGPHAVGARRRFVSQVYLGASRAKSYLELYATKESGGASSILRFALDRGALMKRVFDKLPAISEIFT